MAVLPSFFISSVIYTEEAILFCHCFIKQFEITFVVQIIQLRDQVQILVRPRAHIDFSRSCVVHDRVLSFTVQNI